MERIVYPIIIWPFREPQTGRHLSVLIDYVASLQANNRSPVTVIVNQCSKAWLMDQYIEDFKQIQKLNWTVEWIWSVDTCQSWLEAFARTHSTHKQEYPNGDVRSAYILIPGDFHYASSIGELAFSAMGSSLQSLQREEFVLSVGQISTQPHALKDLVDNYGTWRLLEHWFPKEKELLQTITTKPRSEFIGLTEEFLESNLCERWFPYEQTLVFLLRLIKTNALHQVYVYELGPLEEDEPSQKFQEVVSQIERIERVLKMIWRLNQQNGNAWESRYYALMQESHRIIEGSFAEIRQMLY